MTGYADIAQHFRTLIRDGTLKPGDRLPSIRQVVTDWGVSSSTASRAYKTLKAEGLTRASTGGGTNVARQGSENVAARVRSYASTGKALASDESSEILEVMPVGADETVASRLGVEPGEIVHLRRRLVKRGGSPVHLSSSYYAAYVIEAAPELAEPVSTGGSRELAAERLGIPQGRVLEEVTSRMATEEEKQALGVRGQVVVTQVIRTVFLADDRIVEVAVKICNGSTVLKWTTALD